MTTRKKGHSLGTRYEKPVKPTGNRVFTGLERTGQLTLLEFVGSGKVAWIVWLAYDQTRTVGSYLELHKDGSIIRVDKRVTHTDRAVVTPRIHRERPRKTAVPPP